MNRTGGFLRHGADGLFAAQPVKKRKNEAKPFTGDRCGGDPLRVDRGRTLQLDGMNETLSHTGRAFLFLRILYLWKAQRVRGLGFRRF